MLFNTLKTFFGITAQTEQHPLAIIEGKKNMFARITEDNKLFSPNGELIGTYSRRRDAVRGAARRGFTLAA